MKIIYQVLTILIFLNLRTKSQDLCGTDPNSPDYLQTISNPLRNTSGPYTVRIFAHFIRDGAGTGGITPAEFTTALQVLSDDLAPHNICISLKGTENINDDVLYYGHFLASSVYNAAYSTNPHSDAIDIYFFPNSSVNFGGRADNIPGSALVMGGTWTSPAPTLIVNTSHIISHEFGHCLGLYHTHHGVELTGVEDALLPWNNGACPDANVPCGTGGGCLICGDYVCDTRPDHNMNYTTDQFCNWSDAFLIDPCGSHYSPYTWAIMSYAHPSCFSAFTIGQGQRMRDMIANNPILQAAIVPEDVYIENKAYFSGTILYAARETITAGEDVTSGTNGPVLFIANAKGEFKAHTYVRLLHGFSANPASSGSFHAFIDPAFCSVFTPNQAKPSQFPAYHPLLNNSKWLSTFQGIEGNISIITEALMDTTINGFVYKKTISTYVYLTGIINDPNIIPGTIASTLILREDTIQKKIYSYNGSSDVLLFDFSLSIGSQHPFDSTYLLTTIDSINTNAGYRNRFTFSNGSYQIKWVEGVGNVESPLINYFTYDTIALTLLICSYQNNILVYDDGNAIPLNCASFLNVSILTNNDNFTIKPNPSNGNFIIHFMNNPSESLIKIYNTAGMLIYEKNRINMSFFEINLSHQPKGVYFIKVIEGEKVTVNKIVLQ